MGGDSKPGGTAVVAFGKTVRRVIKQGTDDLGRWTWMALEGADNTVILVMSIYQSCRNPTNPQGRTAHHQQEVLLSERNRTDTDPRRNFYRDMCKFLQKFKKDTEQKVRPLLIGDWNEECMGSSNSKKLCDEFGLANIFHGKHPNHKKFKTYQEGSRFIDYGLIHRDLLHEIEIVTYKPFGYRKGKGDHRGWYFDIRERRMFGNQIEKVYQSDGRNLHSKDSKQLPVYLRAVDDELTKRKVYKRVVKLMKSKRKRRENHKEAEAIDRDITESTQHGEQQCEKRHMDFWDFVLLH